MDEMIRSIDLKVKLILSVFVLLISIFIFISAYNQINQRMAQQDLILTENELTLNNILRASENELTDEVYTFTAPQDELSKFVALEEEYLYYISVELVTPHNCLMSISIEDPVGYRFNLFENDMFYDPEYGRSYEVPFGAASSGIYNITFHVESTSNLNIHVKLERSIKCLHDKMRLDAVENIIFYEVTTFDDNQVIYIEHDVELNKNTMYDFYIGRVSAISKEENSVVKLNYTIEDPNGVEFSLYSQNFLAGVNDVNQTFFGTSINGSHSIKIAIECNVDHVNVAYAIVEDYSLSNDGGDDDKDISPADETSSDDGNLIGKKGFDLPIDSNTSDEVDTTIMELPQEMTIGTMVSVGGMLGTMIIALINHKKRNIIKI